MSLDCDSSEWDFGVAFVCVGSDYLVHVGFDAGAFVELEVQARIMQPLRMLILK